MQVTSIQAGWEKNIIFIEHLLYVKQYWMLLHMKTFFATVCHCFEMRKLKPRGIKEPAQGCMLS